MFRTSNKVTRPEKALILGFMAGSRGSSIIRFMAYTCNVNIMLAVKEIPDIYLCSFQSMGTSNLLALMGNDFHFFVIIDCQSFCVPK
jgi:hypothetical protein